MVQARASSAKADGRKTDAKTSGPNAKASATSTDKQGVKEKTTSRSFESFDGPVTEKYINRGTGESRDSDGGSWTLISGGTSPQSKDGNNEDDGKGVFASVGKTAIAGVLNGEAFATTK